MTCPNCGAGLDVRSRFCNHCGQAQQPSPPADNQTTGSCFQPPQPPPQGLQGLGDALGGKTHLVLAVCCFGWAGLFGLPRCVNFVAALFRWSWGPFALPPFSGWFSVGLHFVLPLVAGLVLLSMYRRNANRNE